MMIATLGNQRVEAVRGMEHRTDYLCPQCRNPVLLHARINGWVIPHFKHKPGSKCTYGRGETKEHRAVKSLVRDHYRSKGYDVKLEHVIGNRRADVFVLELNAALEVEFSPKEANEFLAKCRDYARSGVRSLWILRQDRINYGNLMVGETVTISISRVLSAWHKSKIRGPDIAFFGCYKRQPIIFRGEISPAMLYKEEFGENGGFEYASRRHMHVRVKEIIRANDLTSPFPPAAAQQASFPAALQMAA